MPNDKREPIGSGWHETRDDSRLVSHKQDIDNNAHSLVCAVFVGLEKSIKLGRQDGDDPEYIEQMNDELWEGIETVAIRAIRTQIERMKQIR